MVKKKKKKKTLRNLLLQNQNSFEVEIWYIALRTQDLLIFFLNDDPGMTFDLLGQGQICISVHLNAGNVKKNSKYIKD